MTVDIREFDSTFILEFAGPERRADDRDASCESKFPVNIAGLDGQTLFTGLFGRIDIFSFDIVSHPVRRQH